MTLKSKNLSSFSFVGEVWRWPGYSGWHFVNLPKAMAKRIKSFAKTYGSGFVRARVTVGKSSWETALFPHRQSETYLVSIKKSIRKKEGIWERDKVKVKLSI